MREKIEKCIEVLKNGGIILYPTDTVWGIGCDATNEEAVKRIFEIKQRVDSKSLITIVSSDRMLENHVTQVPDLAWDIIDLAAKPTTIIYPNGKNLASNCLAEDGSIGIRLIKEGFANQLSYKFNKPIISTSANISGSPTPNSYDEISSKIISLVDFAVSNEYDSGVKNPSSILKIGLKGEIEVIRK